MRENHSARLVDSGRRACSRRRPHSIPPDASEQPRPRVVDGTRTNRALASARFAAQWSAAPITAREVPRKRPTLFDCRRRGMAREVAVVGRAKGCPKTTAPATRTVDQVEGLVGSSLGAIRRTGEPRACANPRTLGRGAWRPLQGQSEDQRVVEGSPFRGATTGPVKARQLALRSASSGYGFACLFAGSVCEVVVRAA